MDDARKQKSVLPEGQSNDFRSEFLHLRAALLVQKELHQMIKTGLDDAYRKNVYNLLAEHLQIEAEYRLNNLWRFYESSK